MSSKYDVVKLRIHLSDEHYYVLSRFLLSKMLMFCRIPEDAAVRISLNVKKHFVNAERTAITQAELEDHLQSAILSSGFSAAHTRLFPVVTQFHAERVPLVLFISGPAHAGKTTLAYLMSARLNCSAIINTEVLHDIAESVDDVCAQLAPNCGSASSASADGVETDAAVEAEVEKALREGKVIILEGERLRLSRVRRYLTPCFQKAAGAVILGIAVAALEAEAASMWAGLGAVDARRLLPTDTVGQLSIHSVALRDEDASGGTSDDDAMPTVYTAQLRALENTMHLAAYLHDVIVQRIVEELKSRGKLSPPCPPV